MPAATTLREEYVPLVFHDTIRRIREEIGNNSIYISVDETVDASGRCVTHAIIGALLVDRPSVPRLINCEEIPSSPNGNMIQQFVNRSLNILWPGGIQYGRVLLYVTDAAAYMKSSGRLLSGRYTKMVHVTCLAHACHNVAEKVRVTYGNANDIISDMKDIFARSRQRINQFQTALPHLALPPKPVVTRWGTWLKAAEYYCLHYDDVQDFVLGLEADSQAVERLQENFTNETHAEFQFVTQKFSCIIEVIKVLQTRGISIVELCDIIEQLVTEITEDPEIPDEISEKVEQVIQNNTGFTRTIRFIKNCLENNEFINLPPHWTPDDARNMIFAPLQSAEVERSFSHCKAQYRSNRRGFVFSHFAQYVIIYYNQFQE